MLKLIITASMLLAGLFCQAQVSEARETKNFTEIEVSSGIQLVYTETEMDPLVKVEASTPEIVNQVATISDGNRLSISFSGPIKKGKNIKVLVSAKYVALFLAEQESTIRLANNVHAADIEIRLASGSTFNGYIQATGSVTVNAAVQTTFNGRIASDRFSGYFSDNAKVCLSGFAREAKIICRSGSLCEGKNFMTENTNILSDNAIVHITSKEAILIQTVDEGKVFYQGSPKKAYRNKEAFVKVANDKQLPVVLAMD